MKKFQGYTESTEYIEKEMQTEAGGIQKFTVPKKTYHFQNQDYESELDAIKAEKIFIRENFSRMVECPECYCETCFPEENDTEDTMCDVCLQVEEIKQRIWTMLSEAESAFMNIENIGHGNSYFWEMIKDMLDD